MGWEVGQSRAQRGLRHGQPSQRQRQNDAHMLLEGLKISLMASWTSQVPARCPTGDTVEVFKPIPSRARKAPWAPHLCVDGGSTCGEEVHC